MDKEIILKQIMKLPKKSRFLVGYNEMAKDLAPLMKDDEIIQGVTTAYKKSLLHFVKNGKMIRSFMAVTNKNIYIISSGRMSLSLVPFLKDNIIIPRDEIVNVRINNIATALKVFYDDDITITTKNESYDIYMGSGYKDNLPENWMVNPFHNQNSIKPNTIRNTPTVYDNVDNTVGKSEIKENESFSNNDIEVQNTALNQEEVKSMESLQCINCGNPLTKGAKFCKHCGAPVNYESTLTESPVVNPYTCINCGGTLTEGAKFCKHCGTPVVNEIDEDEIYLSSDTVIEIFVVAVIAIAIIALIASGITY